MNQNKVIRLKENKDKDSCANCHFRELSKTALHSFEMDKCLSTGLYIVNINQYICSKHIKKQ